MLVFGHEGFNGQLPSNALVIHVTLSFVPDYDGTGMSYNFVNFYTALTNGSNGNKYEAYI
jgi:hypothetical protein